jgi:hypothetical protein
MDDGFGDPIELIATFDRWSTERNARKRRNFHVTDQVQ